MAQARIERMLNEVQVTNYSKLTLLTLAAAVVSLILVFTSMTSGELTAGVTESPSQESGFVYFPGQYVNQATGPSEHIQAF